MWDLQLQTTCLVSLYFFYQKVLISSRELCYNRSMATRRSNRNPSPWTFDAPAPIDADDMREDGLPAIVELFSDAKQAKRRANFLGWVALPTCPYSGKTGVCHPDYAGPWAQKTRSERRGMKATIAKIRANATFAAAWYARDQAAYGF